MPFFAQYNLFEANVYMCYENVHLGNLSDISAYRNHNVFLCPVPNQLQPRGVSPCIVTHLQALCPAMSQAEPTANGSDESPGRGAGFTAAGFGHSLLFSCGIYRVWTIVGV